MIGISDIYTREVHKNLHPLFANWEPGQPIKMGDYGIIEKNKFQYMGNINDFGINFKIRKDRTSDTKRFISGKSSTYNVNPKGSTHTNGILNINANLTVTFGNENGVFFNASDCKHHKMQNITDVGKKILDLHKNNEWKKRWSVITDLIKARSTTILVSTSSCSSAILDADANIQNFDLADPGIKLKIQKSKGVGYSLVTSEGLNPLFGLAKIVGIIKRKEFRHYLLYKKAPSNNQNYDTEYIFKRME